MTHRAERLLVRVLWTAWGALAAGGLCGLAAALFLSRPPRELPRVPELVLAGAGSSGRADGAIEALAAKRMSKHVAVEAPRELPKGPSGPVPLDSIIRLRGIMNFGEKAPAVAVLELPGEQKTRSFQAGDTISKTGAVLKAVGETVVVEYDRRRWKLTYKGAQELPAATLGDNR
jgi:hypothetical protein